MPRGALKFPGEESTVYPVSTPGCFERKLGMWKTGDVVIGMMTFPIYGKIKSMFQSTNQKSQNISDRCGVGLVWTCLDDLSCMERDAGGQADAKECCSYDGLMWPVFPVNGQTSSKCSTERRFFVLEDLYQKNIEKSRKVRFLVYTTAIHKLLLCGWML